ncbi:sigma-70 family RNA polymerase sigma factor family protein [Streptomyces fructofermentans]|uniref:RNA polymerase sigma factor n=1 Tax=Streptomyces fructofermentans TaxID=152141 RepID=A0A918NKR4_9ACTN|nr:RNA polymerase subunit sigma [Streptomyces fructofermentans]GGX76186.1 RNA polymerase sigma factor [Streptomyces fructofermentans]
MNDADDSVSIAELLDERQHLLDVARRMLGNDFEAEGATAEAYRRWFELPGPVRAGVAAPRAWLADAVCEICTRRVASVERRKVLRAGESRGGTADLNRVLQQEVSEALHNALGSLSAAERGAFVLADAPRAAGVTAPDVTGRAEPGFPDLADRALRSLRARRARPTTPQQHDAVVRTVRAACATEDAALLSSLLAPDAMAFFDGGGKVRARTEPVHGDLQVARSLLSLLTRCPRVSLHTHSVNGRTGIVVRCDRRVAAVISLDITGHHAVQVWVTLNPDKLRSWNREGTPGNRPGRESGPSEAQEE